MTILSNLGPFVTRRAVLGASAALASAAVLWARGASAQSGPEWRDLTVAGPAPRFDHTLSADDEAKQLVLFGGRGADYVSLGDTWVYSFANRAWTQVAADGPSPRFGHAVAIDREAGRLLLFGGQSADQFFNDLWELDLGSLTWTQIDDGAGTAPSPRYGLAAVPDNDGRIIVSHGFTFQGRFNDTWRFDASGAGWQDVSPEGDGARPLNRCLHEQSWDAASKTMLLYGGCSSGFGPCPQGDLWRFDPAERTWTEITPGSGPTPRSNPALVADKSGERVLLVGGSTSDGYAMDVWEGKADGDSFAWTWLEVAGSGPAGRASHDAVWSRGDLYLFGGTGVAGVTADLWKLSMG
jgi:hypothetical protein